MVLIKRFVLLLLAVGLTAVTLNGLPAASAQEEETEGIGISPTRLNLDADPGETLEGEFTVINGGSSTLRYHMYVSDFSIANEEYDKNFEEPVEGSSSIVDWFNITAETMELDADGQEIIGYSINVPQDAVPRGYYAVIFAETMPGGPDATGVARVKRVGSLVYLTVNGGSVERGQLLSFDVAGWYRKQPVTTEIRVQNDGNVHFDAKVDVRLKDIFGRTVRTGGRQGTVLPATVRKFSPELAVSLPVGLYKVEGSLTFLEKTVNLGPKWVLVASPGWLAVIAAIAVAWIITLGLWIKRRVRRKKH